MDKCFVCEKYVGHGDFQIYENIETEVRICICNKCDNKEQE